MSNRISIVGGRVIDPGNNIDGEFDIEIIDGKISNVSTKHDVSTANYVVDAKGCLVVPGLIDIHTHVYEYATELGVNPDSTCLARGVTTVVDCGSSGAMTFDGLRKYICEKSNTRVLAFLHVARHGLAGAGCSGPEFGAGGESDHLNAIQPELCAKVVADNSDVIVGVKVRLDKNITDEGRTEFETFRRARTAAKTAGVPLIVHHTNSGIPLGSSDFGLISCPGSLQPGDIYTHTYHGHPSSILDRTTNTIYPSVLEAKQNGVIFDVGHGAGSFDWDVLFASAKIEFWPDIISTDLHTENVNGIVKDLTNVASKFLHSGMKIEQIIRAVTINPAKAMNRHSTIGTLGIGRDADVTLLKIVDCDEESEDSFGKIENLKKKIIPVAVFKAGVQYEIK